MIGYYVGDGLKLVLLDPSLALCLRNGSNQPNLKTIHLPDINDPMMSGKWMVFKFGTKNKPYENIEHLF